MFKINQLILVSKNNEEFTYDFSSGINYFKGANDTGKTIFYEFLDYMLGSSENISKKQWFRDSLYKSKMYFEYDNIEYIVIRTLNSNENYFDYSDESTEVSINLDEFRDKLGSVFTRDEDLLKEIRNFTEENLTFRSFTMFNFLGEKRQGMIQDFFDKCNKLEYSLKLTPILNFIFNNNLEEIHTLKLQLDSLLNDLKYMEDNLTKSNFVFNQVNENLQILGCNKLFNGRNVNEIIKQIQQLKEMHNLNIQKKAKNISNLEVMYNSIDEQIRIYTNRLSDANEMKKDNSNRKILLERLEDIIDENQSFNYLIEPLKKILSSLDDSISFSKYLISDGTIKKLKKDRAKLKKEIKYNDSRFKAYTLEEKSKAIALIEEYLLVDINFNEEDIKKKKKSIREIKEKIKVLQNLDDIKKIQNLSEFITSLYMSANSVSSVVTDDIKNEGFAIKYLKRGNILQPIINDINSSIGESTDGDNKKTVNYYVGSMARHTLIQLCGYLGFIHLLLKEKRYPVIPILVIDHISKPFDKSNAKSIGAIINEVYKYISKDDFQIFIFDDENAEDLGIKPDRYHNLEGEEKSGFNPFYFE